jgi:hypothetical protein
MPRQALSQRFRTPISVILCGRISAGVFGYAEQAHERSGWHLSAGRTTQRSGLGAGIGSR